jgi:hypothetical protein
LRFALSDMAVLAGEYYGFDFFFDFFALFLGGAFFAFLAVFFAACLTAFFLAALAGSLAFFTTPFRFLEEGIGKSGGGKS